LSKFSELFTTSIANYQEVLLALLMIWSLFWKGLALWKAGNKKHKWWFVALFLLNTVGILPIIYLVFFEKRVKKAKKPSK
jgi:hypothetical protein